MISGITAAIIGRQRTAGAIVFHLVLTLFAAVIVFSAIGLRPGARLVPLVIGVPTLIGMSFFLIKEIIGHPATPHEEDEGADVNIGTAGLSALAGIAANEVAEDNALPTDPESIRKRRIFIIWAVLVLVVAWLVNFYVAMVAGLLGIYRYAGIGWVKTLVITAGLVGTVYLAFDVLLGVRL